MGSARLLVFGRNVISPGDLDGDGYDDVVAASSQDDDNGAYAGSAYLFFGSASSVDATSDGCRVRLRVLRILLGGGHVE
ncbi:MAG: hypothetical protein GY913_02575 [Proteobacteria bacterium]|nr:hypothetical protein [Pseudomonadota bacterium]MCP4915783.1 hypothetical protein [Pseudomonadota bacterium]